MNYLYCGNWDFKGERKGVHAYSFEEASQQVRELGVFGSMCGQSILAVMDNKLFSVCELGKGGFVVSYMIGKDGIPEETDVLEVPSAKLSYVEADPRGQYIFVSSMGDGTVRMIKVDEAGKLSFTFEQRLTGHGINPRSAFAKVHSVRASVDGTLLYAANLGADEIDVFRIDRENDRLVLADSAQVDWGTAPRHMALHPSGEWLYVLTETGNRLYVFKTDGSALIQRAAYNTLNIAQAADGATADIIITKDAKNLYTTNRGQSNIAHWKILESGLLDLEGYYDCGGESPRSVYLSEDERTLFCANDQSGTMTVLERNTSTGAVGKVLQRFEVPNAGCVRESRGQLH